MLSLHPRDLVFPENDAFPAKGQTKTAPLCFVSAAQEPGPALPLSTSGRTGQGFKQGVASHQVGEDTLPPPLQGTRGAGRGASPSGGATWVPSHFIAHRSRVCVSGAPSILQEDRSCCEGEPDRGSLSLLPGTGRPRGRHQAARWFTWAFGHRAATLQKEPKSRKETVHRSD